MIELTLDQVRALAEAGTPPTVIDPTTRQLYVLLPADGHGAVAGGDAIPWRKQLYIKGRNMTVRQLLSTVVPNGLTEQ